MTKEFGFIVETDKYTGNFEREMCAYMTGWIGDCGVGDKESELFFDDYDSGIEGLMSKPDEHGCRRPVEIICTDGYPSYQALVIHCYRELEENEINIMKERAMDYAKKKGIEIMGFKWLTIETKETLETI